jgi:threonine/homoserine/homoserine lactone efflux protein
MSTRLIWLLVTWSTYAEFLAFAIVVILVPGPDFAVVTKNTLVGGRAKGRWTSLGVCTSAFVQGTAAAFGLSTFVVRAQPIFETIKWLGVAYLLYLGAHSVRSAIRGDYKPIDDPTARRTGALGSFRQGFVTNITNPKVLFFYLAVLPQFLRPDAGPVWLLAFAWSHAALGLAYLMMVTTMLARFRVLLIRRRVRRAMDATIGAVLIGFSAKLATEHI